MGHFKENNNNIQKLLKDKFQICNNSIDISYTMKGRNSLKDVEEYWFQIVRSKEGKMSPQTQLDTNQVWNHNGTKKDARTCS